MTTQEGTTGLIHAVLLPGRSRRNPGAGVTLLPVKQEGLDLLEPTFMAPENWTASYVNTGHLIAALRGQEEFITEGHAALIRERREEVWNRNVRRSEDSLLENLEGDPIQVACHLRRVTKTGACLMVQPMTVNGTELGTQEW